MKDIVVLAPIMDVFEKAVEIVSESNYSNVDVVLGTMAEGLKIAKQLEKDGVKVIVTRGWTYKMVKEALKIPVVEIKVSAYDIIESFEAVADPDEVVGLAGYSSVVYGFDILEKLIPNKVVKIVLQEEEDVYKVIEEYKNNGIKTYIGDSNVSRIVEGLNCRGIVIKSNKDSILTAMQEARRINSATKEEKRRAQQVSTMADFVHDAIVSIDAEERVTIFNKAAERIFGVSSERALGRKIEKVMPNSMLPYVLKTGKTEIGEIETVCGFKVSANRAPIQVNGETMGAVATFQEVTELQNIEQKIRRSLNDKGFVAKYHFSDIVHVSKVMDESITVAKEYSRYDTPIHICGESGVGKELFCQSVHNHSDRRNGPFVAINCAAIPPSLIESEFFGYEEGSFTGAKKKGKAGVFELAHKGTLFLDEISEIPKELQGRLLRVLQEKQVMRIGGDRIIPIDVKIITATNRYLKMLVDQDDFRKDLFYRINILSLRLPPLRKRREDIPVLARFFLDKYAGVYDKEPLLISGQVEDLLMERSYEGNIRELENLMERCTILSSFEPILEDAEKSPKREEAGKAQVTEEAGKTPSMGTPEPPAPVFLEKSLEETMDLRTLEDVYIRRVYQQTGNNVGKTCEILGINRSTLWRKMKEERMEV